MPKIRFLPIFIVVFWVCSPAFPQDQENQKTIKLTGSDLIKIAVENIERNDKLKTEFVSFKRTHIEEELDRSGRFKSILNGPNGKTTLHGKAYPENEREVNSGFTINLNGILLSSYEYDLLDTYDLGDNQIIERYQNKPNGKIYKCGQCYMVKFWPKSNIPDVHGIAPGAGIKARGIHEVAMRMKGIIYIDREHLFIRRHTGELAYEWSMYGFRATMASIDVEQELRPNLDKIIVVGRAEIKYQLKVAFGIFGYQTRNLIWQYSDYSLNSNQSENP